MPSLVIIVDADIRALKRVEELVSAEGHSVRAVSSFQEAKRLLHTIVNPDLLIAAVQLDAYNGLQLVGQARSTHPSMPAIVTHPSPEPVLEREATLLGAAFVVDAPANSEFLPAVRSALQAPPPTRRWSRKQASSVMEVQLANSRGRVLDISYGGMRLAFVQPQDLPAEFDIILPGSGVKVRVKRVWTSRSDSSDEFLCGTEIEAGAQTLSQWRELVDAVH